MISIQFLLLLMGFFFLYIGAELLVRNSSNFALVYGIKKVIIASTFIAVGTSAPEFFITFISSFNKAGDIGIGNIIGSNISNILLVFGLAIIFGKISINPQINKLDIPTMLLETLMLLFFLKDFKITRFEGLLLLIPFLIYMTFLFNLRREDEKNSEGEIFHKNSKLILLLLIIAGILLLYIGAKISIRSGIKIAKYFDVPPLIIGLSLIAVGSSLPELFTSIIASFKKEPDISLGNVVGSNIFNIGFVVGVTGLIKPFSFDSKNTIFNVYILLLVSFILLLTTLLNRKKTVPKTIGYAFTFSFFYYIFYLYRNFSG